jgi:hypothetical protein
MSQVVYVMVSNHRDTKGVDARRSRQNRFPQYFFGDFQDRLLDRQDRDTRQRVEAALSEGGIAVGRFIEHVLRGDELIVRPLCSPPPLRQ